ncbi:MAG: hypothetical protein A3B38_02840 [Candidatus Levybacteria bacterium RIFCSPLOWO2_01_FULL_36_13]|nr:MAG: hypothetical protein A3B38_02840 [Candidatus Levybacteria bacterium RIFCSPLOWO2_01_FULL_36_13]
MKQEEIRFAVGEIGNQLSPVLKIWNKKNDVYLSGKFTGGAFKISLHETGKWIVAASAESKIELKPGSRRMKTWGRPAEFKKGWTWGPHIAVPRMSAVDNLLIDEKQAKQIEWISAPAKGVIVTIAVVFAAPDLSTKDLGQICTDNDVYLDNYLELENLQKVFIRAKYEKLIGKDYQHVKYLELEARQITKVNKNNIKGFIVMFMQAAEVPYVYALKFGSYSTNI